jgi:cytochrome P450
MRFLISKEGSREKSSLISPSLAEHFTKALDLIHFVRQKDSDFMKDTLLLAREIQSLREDLQLFSKQHDSIFTKYAKELQQPFLFRRTKEMTPKIRQEMQQNLGTWEKKLSLVIEHLA